MPKVLEAFTGADAQKKRQAEITELVKKRHRPGKVALVAE